MPLNTEKIESPASMHDDARREKRTSMLVNSPPSGFYRSFQKPAMNSRLRSAGGTEGGLALAANFGCDAIGRWEEWSLVHRAYVEDHGIGMPKILNWHRSER